MKAFLSFVVGLLLGAGLHWYFGQPRTDTLTIEARDRDRDGTVDQQRVRVESDGSPPSTSASTSTTNLTPTGPTTSEPFNRERIKEELARTGQVIREKARAAGDAVADATADARISATIKGKLIKESNLAAFKIDVDTHDAAVTLSGTVASPDHVARAVELAYETEGVRKVTSTLEVKAP